MSDDNDIKLATYDEHPGNIVLQVGDGTEVMRFEPNGDIFVKGRLVENDKEVVDGFKEWLATGKFDVRAAKEFTKALEYYACPDHYEVRVTLAGDRQPGVLTDCGDIARKALGR